MRLPASALLFTTPKLLAFGGWQSSNYPANCRSICRRRDHASNLNELGDWLVMHA